jgi:centrosomal protein CEP290
LYIKLSILFKFEEISGKMPDKNQSIPNQLDQAMVIIREHIQLLAEAKVQSEFSKKRIQELEENLRKAEHNICIRDKAIAELRLRLPASIDRDNIIEISLNANRFDSITPTKAAQTTIESLQIRLNQKEQTIMKYQDMLKLSRDEISKINKQHELEINNLFEKLNFTRDNNLEQIKESLRYDPKNDRTLTKNELQRLQELEEVTIDQDNTISVLNEKINKMNSEILIWKSRYELLIEKCNKEREKYTLQFGFNFEVLIFSH